MPPPYNTVTILKIFHLEDQLCIQTEAPEFPGLDDQTPETNKHLVKTNPCVYTTQWHRPQIYQTSILLDQKVKV